MSENLTRSYPYFIPRSREQEVTWTYGDRRRMSRAQRKMIQRTLYGQYPKGVTPPRKKVKERKRVKPRPLINVVGHRLPGENPVYLKPVKHFKQTVALNPKGKAIFWKMEDTKAFSILPRTFIVAVLRELQNRYGDPTQPRF